MDKGRYGMVGNQIGFKYDKSNCFKQIELLYKTVTNRISAFLEYYRGVVITDVQILYVKVNPGVANLD